MIHFMAATFLLVPSISKKEQIAKNHINKNSNSHFSNENQLKISNSEIFSNIFEYEK